MITTLTDKNTNETFYKGTKKNLNKNMDDPIQEYIKKCQGYCEGVELAKESGDIKLYKAITKPGARLLPLGLFTSELAAVKSLYDYLVANGYVKE